MSAPLAPFFQLQPARFPQLTLSSCHLGGTLSPVWLLQAHYGRDLCPELLNLGTWPCDRERGHRESSPWTFSRILLLYFWAVVLQPEVDHICWNICLMSQVHNTSIPKEQNQHHLWRPELLFILLFCAFQWDEFLSRSSLPLKFSFFPYIDLKRLNNVYQRSLKQFHMKTIQCGHTESSLPCDILLWIMEKMRIMCTST